MQTRWYQKSQFAITIQPNSQQTLGIFTKIILNIVLVDDLPEKLKIFYGKHIFF